MSEMKKLLALLLALCLALTLLPTTDLVLDAEEKKRRVKFFTNPELCKITEDLVLTEPYYDYKCRNILFPGTGDFVREHLYEDETLHAEVALLRLNFMNNAQALLHGDLHSGSIFINDKGLKVLDPEFAFYGPMGYDIGNVIGNLFFAWANKAFTAPEETETMAAIETCIAETWDLTRGKLEAKFDELVTLPLYQVPAFKNTYLDGIMADAAGYAGTEIIRRTVGDSKVMEVTSVTDAKQRIPMERALVKLGIALIKNRKTYRKGRELTEAFRLILA
jgi:5-methylthioribose kinase